MKPGEITLIVGAGSGLSASLAKLFARASGRGPDGMLLPDEIANTYLAVYRQHRSAWTWEVELRPWVEKF